MSDDEVDYSMRHEDDEGEDSVGEDAELELSCALQDLALRVKTFEENMKGRFFRNEGEDDIDDEIDEDIPEADTPASDAEPKQQSRRRKESKKKHRKMAHKQQEDEDDEYCDEDEDPYGDDEFSDENDDDDPKSGRRDDWDYQEQTEELSELKHNIALLLQGFKEEAKALELGDNQAK